MLVTHQVPFSHIYVPVPLSHICTFTSLAYMYLPCTYMCHQHNTPLFFLLIHDSLSPPSLPSSPPLPQVHLLHMCDLVLVLEDGKVKAFGSFEELQQSGIDIEAFVPNMANAEVHPPITLSLLHPLSYPLSSHHLSLSNPPSHTNITHTQIHYPNTAYA